MQYVHRWDLGDRGKLFMVTEETKPKGTISLSNNWEGKVKSSHAAKVIKLLGGAPVTQEIEVEEEATTVSEPKTATVANILRSYAKNLEEK